MLVRVVRLAPRAPAIARLGMLVRGLSSGPSTATTATKDKLLFTPGPLSTSPTVKAAMQRDLGSRDVEFIRLIKEVRSEVLRLANVSEKEFAMIPMQGSGTFGVEAVISSVIPRDKRLLLIANGAYGHRIGKMAKAHNIKHTVLSYPEDGAPVLSEIEAALKKEGDISHVAIVHSETTSGIINDIHSVGQLVAKYQKSFIVDAMSSFGALPIDFAKARIDYLVTSANKCLHGVPGFAIIIANRAALAATAGNARTLSLDVLEQLKGLDGDGQFRFTPPTHAMLACRQAIREIEAIGGVKGRFEAYRKNHAVIVEGLKRLGFVEYLPVPLQGPIISTWKYPTHPNWSFNKFYSLLNDRGFVIYPGKVTNADCFRIGHIGHITVQDSEQLVKHIAAVLDEMGIKLK